MWIAPPPRCVEVLVKDAALRDAVCELLARAGLQPCPGESCPKPHLVAIATVPGCAAGLAPRAGDGAAVVLISTGDFGMSRAEALRLGADDLVRWPAEAGDLAPVVDALLHRRERDLWSHPLTRLPGGAALHAALEECIGGDEGFGLVAVDIEHFKAFNDRYGFSRGDRVLHFLGRLLSECVGPGERVFHLGGDDFFILTSRQAASVLADVLPPRFNEKAGEFYDEADREQGFVPGISRETGMVTPFPLMTVCVVAIAGGSADASVDALAGRVAEEKERARGAKWPRG